MNPELRQTLNTISRNIESANEAAQENIYTFTQLVIDPCFNGFKACFTDCTASCYPKRENRIRRQRARSRGRSDLHFDFYDDWEDEDEGAFGTGSWGNDELDSLLAGRGPRSTQPGRQRGMSYGTKGRRPAHAPGEENPTIIPSSSYIGFLEQFKWRPGARGIRYKPSAADLQEHPGNVVLVRDETEPLIEESDEDEEAMRNIRQHKRQRSDTNASRSTLNSLSSRGDLIMGDEEDDAQPLGDEFAVMLTRTNTNNSRRPGISRKSTRTVSTKSGRSAEMKRSTSGQSLPPIEHSPTLTQTHVEPPSIANLQAEEEHLQYQQEKEIAQKRKVALQAAKERGLDSDKSKSAETLEPIPLQPEPLKSPNRRFVLPEMNTTPIRSPTRETDQRSGLASPVSVNTGYNADSETEPFPSYPASPTREFSEVERPP